VTELWADPSLGEIALRTLLVSGVATAAAMAVGVPLGYALGRRPFRGQTFLFAAINTGMGIPPVLVGLVVWLLLVRSGPFGAFELVYTKTAMVLAQFFIALPVIIGFSAASIEALSPRLPDLLAMLGAGPVMRLWLIAREARFGLLAAVMAAFGGVVSEVGAAMAVGGNLQGSTRVLTTAIVTETGRGHADQALALGMVLLVLAFGLNLGLTLVQQRRRRA
jgi:tungstate transport system permease protein